MQLQNFFRISGFFILSALAAFSFGSLTAFAEGEPVVVDRFAESIMPTSATPTAEITDEGLAPVIGIWLEYGLDNTYGWEIQRNNINELTIPGVIDVPITDLMCETTYHYRFRARNNGLLDGYSPDATFTTSSCYPENTISHWTLNETSGTRADSIGENDLSPINAPLSKTGQINDGVEATIAGSDYLTIDDNASLSTGGETSFTISLWVKLNAKTGTQVFVSKYGTGGEYAVYYESVFDRFVFSTYPGSNAYVLAEELGSPSTGVWYHITATHDAVANTNSITINNGTPDVISDVEEHADSTANFLIGAFGPTPTFFADAIIDDVRFSKTVHGGEEPLDIFAGGTGTGLDPYQISTCQQLQDINQDLDAEYILINDIDCLETETWNVNLDEWVDGDTDNDLIPDAYTGVINNGYYGFEPIGQAAVMGESLGFTGTLNGQGYSITDLWIFRKDQSHNGVIGYATGATIENITLNNARIVGGSSTGGFLGFGSDTDLDTLTNTNGMVRAYLSYYGGGIAGQLFDNSSGANLTVTGGNVHGSGNVIGGLIGSINMSNIIDSDASADIDGGEYIGGAIGTAVNAIIENVHATGNVLGVYEEDTLIPGFTKNGNYTGGFVGRIESSEITNTSATGNVTSEGGFAGGFVGEAVDVVITDSYATGIVIGQNSTGGFAGQANAAELTDVYASGDVTGSDYVGGFAGGLVCGTTVTRAYARGDATATGESVGGFVGFDGCEGPGAIYDQVSAHGDIIGTNNIGGFVGYSSLSDFTDVYASGDVTGSDYVGGFVGYAYHPFMTNAYSRGSVDASGENVGGFVGVHYVGIDERNIYDSFWDGNTTTQEVGCADGECSGVTEKTTLQMKTQTTFTDVAWNFNDVWVINNTKNNGYPHFQWETFDEEGPIEILVTTNAATDIAQTSATIHATVTGGSFNAYGFFIGTESHEDNIIPAYDEYSEINDVFEAMFELYPGTLGDGGFEILEPPFDYEIPLEDLTCDMTYYFRPLVYLGMEENLGLGIGEELSFTTLPCDNEEEPAPRRSSGGSVQMRVQNLESKGFITEAQQIKDQFPQVFADTPITIEALINRIKELQALLAKLQGNPISLNNSQPVLRFGATGEAVTLLQRILQIQPQSGKFLNITDTAVKKFQQEQGLPSDGIVGPMTWEKLLMLKQ
jgi:hypothetical protein